MNSWVIWAAWGAFVSVAILLGFVGRHFTLRTLRYVTAVTAAVLVVLVTRYGLTHPASLGERSPDLVNSFTRGADELSAAFFHPLLLLLPGSWVPAPGRNGWFVIAVLAAIGYRVLEAWAMHRQAPVLDSSALGESQPNGASGKAGDSAQDRQRHDQFVARLKFLLSAIDIRAPAILPGGTRSNGLASIAEASGVNGGSLAGAIIRFFGMLWPNPRRFQVRVRVESGPGGKQKTDSTKVTVSLDEPATGKSVATKTMAASHLDEAAAVLAGFVAWHIFSRDPTTPPWGVGAANGRDLAAMLLATQERVDVRSSKDIRRSRAKQIGYLEKAVGNSQCAGTARYELAQLYNLAEKHMAALRLHAVNREQHPRFYRGRYRLSLSLEMIANPAFQLRDAADTALLEEILTILNRCGVTRHVTCRLDGIVGGKLPRELRRQLLEAAGKELHAVRRQVTLRHVVWGTFRHRDERTIRVPLWGLRKRQSFHDGLCVAELLVAVRLSLNENEAEPSGASKPPKLPKLSRHMKLARRMAADIAGDNVPIEQHFTNPKAQDTLDRPPAEKRDEIRWLPRQRRTPSWEAAYNTACVYAALNLDHRVVVSLQRAINNPNCEMQRPSDWISHDPDFSCLKSPSTEFTGFLHTQEWKDYPAAAANGASRSSVPSPQFVSASTPTTGTLASGVSSNDRYRSATLPS
jgi:hypothetical protein